MASHETTMQCASSGLWCSTSPHSGFFFQYKTTACSLPPLISPLLNTNFAIMKVGVPPVFVVVVFFSHNNSQELHCFAYFSPNYIYSGTPLNRYISTVDTPRSPTVLPFTSMFNQPLNSRHPTTPYNRRRNLTQGVGGMLKDF